VLWRRCVGADSSLLVADEVDEEAPLLHGDVPPFGGLVRVLLAQARDEADHHVEIVLLDEVAWREPRVDAELREDELQLLIIEVVARGELREARGSGSTSTSIFTTNTIGGC
jgi:hypothetical protein